MSPSAREPGRMPGDERAQGLEPALDGSPMRRDEAAEAPPLEGDLLPSPAARFDEATRRMTKPFDALWWMSLGMTAWLAWLTLRGDPGGLMNILLAVVLALPFLVLSAARLGLASVFGLLREGMGQAHGLAGSARQWQATVQTVREQAGKARTEAWVGTAHAASGAVGGIGEAVERLRLLGQMLMLTPAFFAALALSLLATLIMIPVTLFTLLLAVF